LAKAGKALRVTRPQLAALFGVTAARITKYISEGLPTESRGRGKPATFDVAACVRWLLERRAPRVGEDERARYFRLQGDKIEAELRHRAGELVEASEVDRRNAARTLAARERLLQLPSTALQHGIIGSTEQEDKLRALVCDALRELAEKGGYVEPA
jgi:phage terminase Nu1 subunit (DNA packaging protein)